MHPPNHIVEELYRVTKDARLGWDGASKTFALIQLYHTRDSERTFFGDFWRGRGPVFGHSYDPLQKVPMLIAHVKPEEVFSGKVIPMVRRWLTPIKERTMASARKKGHEYQSQLNDLAEAGGDRLYWQAQRGTSSSTQIANKFVTEDDKALLRGDKIKGVENSFVEKLTTGGMPIV